MIGTVYIDTMSDHTTSIVQLFTGEDKSPLAAKSVWKDGDIRLVLIDGTKAYEGSLSADEMEEIKADKNLAKLGEWAEEVFGRSGEASKDHVFAVDTKAKSLSWKYARAGTKVKVNVADIDLKKADFESANREVLGAALAKIGSAEGERRADDEEKESLRKQLERMTALSERFRDEKAKVEKELYEQFLPVLQTKQSRNDELEAMLREARKSGGGGGSTLEVETEEEQEEDDYGGDTDSDGETPSKKLKAGGHESSLNDSGDFLARHS